MARVASSAVLGQIAAVYQVGPAAGLTDGSLLDRFRDGPAEEAEAAFALLVERHAPMILRVCRRVLGDRHDAEDAAQATFLILARRAGSIRRMDSVAGWLCGVAGQVATRARRDADRRRARERRGAEATSASLRSAGHDPDATEAARGITEELGRLPERFRLPVVLFHLEGRTYEEIARQLGCPVRTVQSRLDRGRRRLRDRLARRGLVPSVASLAALLAPDPASASPPENWTQATARAAARYAVSGADAAIVPTTVAALVEGASRAMTLRRLMRWASLSLVGLAAGAAGISILARAAPARDGRPLPSAPADAGRYRVTMAGGATVEVVAVSTVPTGPHTWWSPDGTPLAEPPVDAIEPKTSPREGEAARVILVRSSGMNRDDLFRWHPSPSASYWGGRPRKDGRDVPGLEYYEATFPGDCARAEVRARVAAGAWKTEVSNGGGGGVGQFVNGHKFSFGKARPLVARGESMTVFSVAHNFFGQDRRLVAVDLQGKGHPAVSYSAGSDGDERWVIDLIDGEFPLPPDQIREYQVQFRPIEVSTIKDIALNPTPPRH